MKYIDQMDNIEITIISKPRVFIKWNNTIEGYDRTENYERIDDNFGFIKYVNNNNRRMSITEGTLFNKLEEFYKYKFNG